MYYSPTDYSREEINELVAFFEQYVAGESNSQYSKDLHSILGILRAVNKIGKGTSWLSKLSGT